MKRPVYDLGGTFLRCGLVGEDGTLSANRRHRIERADPHVPAKEHWLTVVGLIRSFEQDHAQVLDATAPAVFSFPGPIADRRRVLSAPTLFGPVSPMPPLAKLLEERTGRSVVMINDVSAAAWFLSERVKSDRFLVVTVSSGIGSKIFDRDHDLGVIDDPPFAGEIGHGVVEYGPDAPLCECGGRGHLGAISSGRGIERFARGMAASLPEDFGRSRCADLGGTPATLTNEEHLVPAALAGDAWALSVIREATRPLAAAIQVVFLAFGLDRVILIGGFAATLGETYRSLLAELLVEHSRFTLVEDRLTGLVEIVPRTEETCLEGAAVYARRISGTARP